MTSFGLLLRSLRHYWRWHAGLALAVALAAAVIAGALAVGDSVKATLARNATERLGRVRIAVVGGEKFFTEALAAHAPGEKASLIVVRGTVSSSDGSRRVGGVNVIGVTEEFWRLGLAPTNTPLVFQGESVGVNAALAEALGNPAGEPVIVRMEKPTVLSKDAPLSGEADQTAVLRGTVAFTAPGAALGNFSLGASQAAQKNVFVPLPRLQEALGQAGRVNVLVTTATSGVTEALAPAWSLEDAGLRLQKIDALGQWDLATTRVFLDPVIAAAVRSAFPQAQGVLTYMVNEIRGPGPEATPYSMATATDGFGLAPDEVALTQWTADDLGAKLSDSIAVSYYQVGRGRVMETRTATFRVKAVLPMEAAKVRPDWTPPFPGIMDAPSCRDWKPGVAMDMTKFRKKDDDYWSTYRATPKFFLSLAAGQQLWSNRFGDVTALRLPADAIPAPETLLEKLRERVGVAELGLIVAHPAEAAAAAVDDSYDLGGLFLGMSFFLIVTALLLVGLMFLFNLESRAAQLGVLRAVGLSARQIRRLLVGEAALVALAGAALGLVGAVVYTRWVLGALSGEWGGAVGGLRFEAAFRPVTLAGAAATAALLATATVWFAAGRFAKLQPRELLAGVVRPGASPSLLQRRAVIWRWLPPALLVASMLVAFLGRSRPLAFFGAGALLMLAGVGAVGAWLRRRRCGERGLSSAWQLGVRNASRKPGRSLAVAGLLAAGVFMISSMAAFQLDARRTPEDRRSGTGGFALVGESTFPLYDDLNQPAGRAAVGLEEEEMAGVSFVQARVRDGDEASCLNLQRPQNPRVLGLPAAALRQRGAFSFAGGATDWSVLAVWDGTGPAPAVMDANYVRYTIKAKLGDVLSVRDDRGGTVSLRLAALLQPSVLQGSAVISEAAFEKLFPESGGYRFFLVDAPPRTAEAIRPLLTRLLENRGFTLTPAATRLNEFNAVQNTYLRIFSALGGLGLVLSTAGLGLLLARSFLERRAEFGVLQAIGFQRGALRRIVIGENAFLLLVGLVIGVTAALVAVWPVSHGASLPGGTLATILLGGLLFCALAAQAALRGRLLEAIRNE